MKRIAAIILALALSPFLSSAAEAAATASVQAAGGRIYVVSGEVTVAQGRNPAHRVTDSEAIVSDTLVNTGDKSAALLKFEDGQVVTLQSNSSFHVFEYRYDAKRIANSNIVFSMFKGGMRFITGLIGQKRKQSFRLLTPSATIGIRGTEFMVAVVDNVVYSQVMSGNIAMTNAAGSLVLGAGQTAAVTSSGALATLVSASAIPAGAFSELLSIPVTPSAIPAPAPVAPPAPPPVPVSIPIPAPVPVPAPVSAPIPVPVPEPTDSNSRSGKGLTAKIGTLGLGAEFNVGLSDRWSTRFGINAYTYKRNANSSTVNYDFKLQLQSASALVDWYPFEGRFRATGGLMYNNNKATLNAKPGASGYTINGAAYSSTDVGSLQGTLSFNKAAPYLGIGWGNPVARNKGWGMLTDFGVMFQGNPKTTLTVTCGTAIVGTPACTQLQTDAAAENTKLQNDLSSFKLWPVASLGISYQW